MNMMKEVTYTIALLLVARSDIQSASVQYILDSVVDELAKNPNRMFNYVEIAFFEQNKLEKRKRI